MKSDERLFWVAVVLAMVVSQVVGGLGVLHRMWPQFFDPPVSVCARVDLRPDDWRDIWPEPVDADPAKPAPLALGVPAGGAISSEAKEVACGAV